MRTGSNFLEANLNALDGVACHGEVFNPIFIAHKGQTELFGIGMAEREADPLVLVRRMRERTQGLAGFRLFHDHDARVLDWALSEPRCAKVVLTRNPLESYVSLGIARETGQWRLSDLKHQKSTRIRFDEAEFLAHLEQRQAFQVQIQHALQVSGQSAFWLDYDDLQDLDVLNGLAAFLGVEARLSALSRELKKQNPEEPAEKVLNPAEMEGALARLDRFNLSRTPSFEPRRGPGVPNAVAGGRLLYLPVRGAAEAAVTRWLARAASALESGFTQKTLREWKRKTPGHRSFTLVRHPVARAHAAYCTTLLAPGREELRGLLRRAYKLRLPMEGAAPEPESHREGFLAFLGWLKGNLAGQTGQRTDIAWATQAAIVQGFAQFVGPDAILREEAAEAGLDWLAADSGMAAPAFLPEAEEAQVPLADIWDAEVEAAVRDTYARDYMTFGFGPWKG